MYEKLYTKVIITTTQVNAENFSSWNVFVVSQKWLNEKTLGEKKMNAFPVFI